jgi:siroheme synthase-like protein
MEGNQLFPVFLKLNHLNTLVIGAGSVGLEKLTAILNNSPEATITVVAEKVMEEIWDLSKRFKVTILKKSFAPVDLDQAQIVVAATNDNTLNGQIRREAHARKLLVNVADKPELCDFYLGSIVQKGNLKIGISTNGKSPTIAKRLKEVLSESLPDDVEVTLQQMSVLRDTLKGDFAAKVAQLNKVTEILITPLKK